MAGIHLPIAAMGILLHSLLSGALSASQCPPRCTCYLRSSDVDCNYCGLRDIPPSSSVPIRTQRFRLKSNSISWIPTRAFESLTELRHLDLSVNAITVFHNQTFLGLEKLELLLLSRNNIECIEGNPFSALSSLKILLLNENRIKVIGAQGFLGLYNLLVLDLSNNSILELAKGVFSHVQALSEIQLTMNKLIHIASDVFQALPQLPTFNLSFNKISNLDKDAFIGVKWSMLRLILDYNNLVTIPPGVFHGLPALEEMSFYGNTIQVISTNAFFDLPSLKLLNLSGNQISILEPKVFQSLLQLQLLDISNNRLRIVKGFTFMGLREMVELNLEFNLIQALEPFSLFGCSSLLVLHLGNNQIHTIHPGAFEGAYVLTALKMENNNLTFWPSEVTKTFRVLKTITLFNNLISELQDGAFAGMGHLHSCNLSQNKLTKIKERAFIDLVNLRVLDLSRNLLSRLRSNLFQLPKLKMLNVSANVMYDIHCDAFSRAGALEVLDLSGGQLSSVPSCALENVPFLLILYLNSNAIQYIGKGAFDKLHNLQELYIQTNGIISIHPLAFLQLRSLRVVNLQSNSLTSVSMQWFSDCSSLEYLSLSNNNIQTINHRFFSEARPFKTFSAQGNPWCCNCSNFWLTEIKSIVDSSLHRLYICHSPVGQRGVNAFEAVGSLPCRAPKISQIEEARKCKAGEEGDRVGEALCLTCKVTGTPDPEVHWILPNHTKGKSEFDSSLFSRTLVLLPGEVIPGNYTCRAVNEIGAHALQVSVNSFTSLLATIPDSKVAVKVNSILNLTCFVTGFPEPSVKWVTPSGSQHPGHQFFMELVSHKDLGTYYCVASNSQMSINDTVHVDFAESPVLQDRLTNLSVIAGHSVVLPCFTSGLPPPQVMWKLPNLQHTDSIIKPDRLKVLDRGELLTDNLVWSDSGVYVCEVVNLAGTNSVVHTVQDHAPFILSLKSRKHLKLLVVALILPPVLIGIGSFCSVRTRKKNRVRIIQVQPCPEKDYKAEANNVEMAL